MALPRTFKLAARLAPAVKALPEVISATKFADRLDAALERPISAEDAATLSAAPETVRSALTAAMATTHLHTHSRIAAYSAYGYYTIGPCGEELMAALALSLRPTDPAALHYRHLGSLVARQLQRGASLEDVLMDRARGYTTATTDPATGGAHCSLGGDFDYDFLVTSTLASQGPQAVGRALAIAHLPQTRWPSDAISVVSVGDGSISNSEWLSAVNAAEYVQHRRRACPTLFVVSDNGLSISLKNHGWTKKWAAQRLGMRVLQADGRSLPDLLRTSADAVEHVRTSRAPATLIVHSLPRRFGHAASDRQLAYLSAEDVEAQIACDPVASAAAMAIHAGVVPGGLDALLDENERIGEMAAEAFAKAKEEPRDMTRTALVARSAPKRACPADAAPLPLPPPPPPSMDPLASSSRTRWDMRPLMTRALGDVIAADERVLYVGEDVEHGGYYRVSEGLRERFGRGRIFDWPPDEASLVGAGIGMAQAGRVPIVEVPYAAYLSCGYNQFVEACFLHWLSNGKQPNGMVLRMQGFDEGVFGGHFHTANAPPVFGIPGLDVLAYSNGRDWARGLRAAVRHASSGGVSMLLDSTALLARRHVVMADRDDAWQFEYPHAPEELAVDDVILYEHAKPTADAIMVSAASAASHAPGSEGTAPASGSLAVVTYGNGVLKALAAIQARGIACDVIDVPLLSRSPEALAPLLHARGYSGLLLVNVCRESAGPLPHLAMRLHSAGDMPPHWQLVTAPPTYNPLGRTLTFVSEDDIGDALTTLAQRVS